ncbi:MAG TPA: hypothetical protein VD788_04810 [Candidatus Polarisedimenticolaceae bacterium]|nr:hypothetical protein [Candidatus Polarisedimenticolaceae bacterium]
MRLKRFLASVSPLLLLLAVSAVAAQDDAPPPEAPPQTEEDETPPPPTDAPEPQAAPTEQATTDYFGLYVEAGSGAWSLDDIDSSIQTLSTALSVNTVSFDDHQYGRAAIGWRLKGGKGDFRLIFNGWSEDGYRFDAEGYLAALDPDLGVATEDVRDPLLWWTITVDDGQLHSVNTPPVWTDAPPPAGDDANGNGFVDAGEQRYLTPAFDFTAETFTSLQNRAQTYDFVFGNVWGPRGFQGRWFAGLRYFVYEGNMSAAAWLHGSSSEGVGYTDGAFLRLLNFHQEASGLGPTGLMEARFNFFNQRLQLYLNGQISFIVEDVSTTSGEFLTLVGNTAGEDVTVPAELSLSQTKSTWHTAAEAGARLRLTSGLELQLSYGVVGLLDAVLLPNDIRIPENATEARVQGTSALYNTQDYVLTGWRAGLAFQF